MTYYSYTNKGLNTFEDVVKAFTFYENGGFWIKKIDKQASFVREIVLGPFSQDKANELSDIWRPNVNIKDVELSKVYTFSELVCCNTDKEYYTKIKQFIDEDYIWKPPIGIKLFCLMKKYTDVALYRKQDLSDVNFVKFQKFAEINGVNKLVVNSSGSSYIIYYLVTNYKGYNRALNLRKFLVKYSNNYQEEEKIYLINKISGGPDGIGVKPDVIPAYLILEKDDCIPVLIYFFKEIMEDKTKNKFLTCFNKLKKCLPKNYVTIKSDENNKIVTKLKVKLITSNKDYRPKLLYISKLSNNKYILELGNASGDYFVKLEEDELRFVLPSTRIEWRKFVISEFNDDVFFDSIEKTLALMLYISKCLGKDKIFIRDDRVATCDCKNVKSHVYINPIRYILGHKNIYYDLGFKDNNNKKIKQVVDKYKNIKLKDFLTLEEEVLDFFKGEELIFLDKTIYELCEMFLEKACEYEEMCNILSLVSIKIFNELYDCCAVFSSELVRKDLGFYRRFF